MAIDPGLRLVPYEIRGLIGAGGMGEVYRARDVRLDRDVAVKVVSKAVLRSAAHRTPDHSNAQAP